MRKSFLMLGMAVAALTSCTQSEVLEIAESRVIGFDSFVGKHTRTAHKIEQTGTQDNDLNKFYVFGKTTQGNTTDDLFNQRLCTYNGTGFTYDNPETWALNTTYNFAAYSNGNGQLTSGVTHELVGTTGSKLTFSNYTVGDKDLLAAINTPYVVNEVSQIPQTVALPFQHLLSCVRITITNASQNLYLKFGNITINAIGTDNCTYQINNGTKTCVWENTTSTASAASATQKAYTFNAPTTNDGYVAPGASFQDMCFFIPQSNDLSFSVNIETYEKTTSNGVDTYEKKDFTTSTASLKINDHAVWQPGYQYNYAASVAGTLHYIRFSATVDSWTPKESALGGITPSQD